MNTQLFSVKALALASVLSLGVTLPAIADHHAATDAVEGEANAEPKAAGDEKKQAAEVDGMTTEKPKAKEKPLGKSRPKLAEPDFDVDQEFNL